MHSGSKSMRFLLAMMYLCMGVRILWSRCLLSTISLLMRFFKGKESGLRIMLMKVMLA